MKCECMIADGLDFFIAAGAGKFPSYLCEPQQIVIQTVSKSEGMETIHTARNKPVFCLGRYLEGTQPVLDPLEPASDWVLQRDPPAHDLIRE